MDYAKTVIVGNLSQNVEVKTYGDTTVAKSSVAVNRYINKDKTEVSFFNITFFGKNAENAGEWLTKGNKVMLECTPQQQSWEDKETKQKRTAIVFVVNTFINLTPKEKSEGSKNTGAADIPDDVPF